MEQQEVKDKLKTGELKRQTRTGKSEVWKSFKLIVENATETCVGFAECSQCGALLSYESKKTGTSTLSRHLNNCLNKTIEITISYIFSHLFDLHYSI